MTATTTATTTLTGAVGPPIDPAIAARTGETLIQLQERATARTPDSVAMVVRRGMRDERWTYRQLAERSLGIAATLRRHGVEPGDRVLTWSQNDPWLVAAYFATWRIGAVIVPLDLRMQTDVAVRIGVKAEPTLLLAGPEVDPEAAEALAVPIVAVDEAGLLPPGSPSVTAGVAEDQTGRPDPETIAEDPVHERHDLGSKGVVLTHRQIVHTARAVAQIGIGRHPDRALAIIPLSHMYGQSVPLLMGLISGSTLVFLHALTPKAISATMKRERVTAVTLVPQLMSVIMDGIESEARRRGRDEELRRARSWAMRLPKPARRLLFRTNLDALGGELRVIASGGARLTPELQTAWESMGISVVQGYGTTECAAVSGHTRERQQLDTVGPPLAGIEVRVADDGELHVRGPNVMQGYWRDPDATAEVLDGDGWFHTGDAATIDEAGELLILGRTRDRIALPNGLNVYPEDVESALKATDTIRSAVAFEVASGRLAAALVPADAGIDDAVLAAAVSAANASLAPHQRIGAWKRWPEDEFPRTHTLKIRREPVTSWYLEAATGPAPTGPTSSPPAAGPETSRQSGIAMQALCDLVAEVVSEARGGDVPVIVPSTTMASLELDSLDEVTLALRIDEAFDAPLTDDEIGEAEDIEALHHLLVQRQGQPPPPPPSRWPFSAGARLVRRGLDATVTGWATRIVARPRYEGLGHLSGLAGPVLICPNHTSHLDAPIVRAGLPAALRDRTTIAAAADVWFDGGPLGPSVALVLAAIPFGRTADVRAALERVANLINDGWSVIIFPEGTRSADGTIGEMRQGIGLLATGLGVPVVPAHIAGAHEILPKGAWLPRHRPGRGITVRYGAPIRLDPATSMSEATTTIGRAIEDLAERPPTSP